MSTFCFDDLVVTGVESTTSGIVGELLGNAEGDVLGAPLGDIVGDPLGRPLGDVVGNPVGILLGDALGENDGESVGESVGEAEGSEEEMLEDELLKELLNWVGFSVDPKSMAPSSILPSTMSPETSDFLLAFVVDFFFLDPFTDTVPSEITVGSDVPANATIPSMKIDSSSTVAFGTLLASDEGIGESASSLLILSAESFETMGGSVSVYP